MSKLVKGYSLSCSKLSIIKLESYAPLLRSEVEKTRRKSRSFTGTCNS